ncbi:TPR-like protein [Auricularia subglabra TFB-10046 SS5]|nr:TPR-like protein [Auricularia subglabra TFB-10046 SS5]
MSLQSLISGAECSTSSNALSQVLKHAEGDRSLQRDRVQAGPSSSQLYRLAPSAARTPAEADIASARQFFEQQQQQQAARAGAFPSFDVERLRSMTPGHTPSPVPADMASAWHSAAAKGPMFTPPAQHQLTPGGSHWASEFELHSAQGPIAHEAGPAYRPAGFMSPRTYQQPFMPAMYSPPLITMGKGKGKATEADFDAAFAQAAAMALQSSARIEEVDQLAETLQGSSLEDDAKPGDQHYMSEFQRSWEEAKQAAKDGPLDQRSTEELAKWEAQFNQVNSEGRLDDDYGRQLQEAYEQTYGSYDDFQGEGRLDEHGVPQFGPYQFEKDNKYMTEGNTGRSHLEEAKELLAKNGSLTEAALLLEAAIQQGDLGRGGFEAWILLGETRSMDEREEAALRALQEGTRLSAAAGERAEGLMSLAISYTNESYERASHQALLRWLSARYPGVQIPEETASPWASHEQATDAFLAVARDQHARGAPVDAELQVGLGVLFYANGTFDRAQDCFETALSADPNDYLLWNRLGSCLSNGQRPEEALGAYRQALQLRPTYTRAIYNVGVACLNIGAYEEAAKHFLSALAMQESNGGPSGEKSQQLWTTLQRCFTYMNRGDLAEMVRKGAPVDSFRLEGFNF